MSRKFPRPLLLLIGCIQNIFAAMSRACKDRRSIGNDYHNQTAVGHESQGLLFPGCLKRAKIRQIPFSIFTFNQLCLFGQLHLYLYKCHKVVESAYCEQQAVASA